MSKITDISLKLRNEIYNFVKVKTMPYGFWVVGETWEGGTYETMDPERDFRDDFVLYMNKFYTKNQFLRRYPQFSKISGS